jgi:hypothetical protein
MMDCTEKKPNTSKRNLIDHDTQWNRVNATMHCSARILCSYQRGGRMNEVFSLGFSLGNALTFSKRACMLSFWEQLTTTYK